MVLVSLNIIIANLTNLSSGFKNCKLKRKCPSAFYNNKHGVFHQNNPKTSAGDGLTDFARAMQEPGMGLICASTPQAKGRVERANKTLQDRLTKELRLHNISIMREVNLWLPKFMEDYNQRLATVPRSEHDFHEPQACSNILCHILCRKNDAHPLQNPNFAAVQEGLSDACRSTWFY